MQILKTIVEVITIMLPLMPLILAATRYLAKKGRNQNIVNLVDRASIIVEAMETTMLDGYDKKNMALQKLIGYANEVGINLTMQQAEDYIEAAVREMNKASGKYD